MIRLAFFDYDNTLYSHKTNGFPKSTLEALRQLREKGVLTALSSGRGPAELSQELRNTLQLDYYICNVGQVILDRDFQPVVYSTIDKDVITRASKYLVTQGITGLNWKGMYHDYRYYQNPNVVRVTPKGFRFEFVESPNMDAHLENDILGGVVIDLYTDIKEVEKLLPELAFIPNGSLTSFDIQSAGINKTKGMDKLMEYLNIPLEDCIAFGDGHNDIEMLTHVPTSVCMGNGVEPAKAAASYVTTDIDDDGIWNALKHFNVL